MPLYIKKRVFNLNDKIKVLVVDDSAFMRKALVRMLTSDPAIEVVGAAQDGMTALKMIHELDPQVITLDIKMPGMDGLETLRRIMREHPTPVLMVSSLTSDGAEETFDALNIGAVDFIDKSSAQSIMDVANIAGDLIAKVKAISGVNLENIAGLGVEEPAAPVVTQYVPPVFKDEPTHIVAIGASTGGPGALERMLKKLPEDIPAAVLVVQHMPPGFTKGLSERLNSLCRMSVKEAEEGDKVIAGRILIAPGGKHMTIRRGDDGVRVALSLEPNDMPHRPSVDVMMQSVAKMWNGRMAAVVLTGMGTDGTEGAKAMKRKGARVIGQDEKSSVVYGMPRSVYQAGIVDRQAHIDYIHQEIIRFCIETSIVS